MPNAYIINAHHYYEFAPGGLNGEIVRRMTEQLTAKGYEVKATSTDEAWDVEEELKQHQWADVIIVQSPVNWMGVPWPMKKFMDEVYTAGMAGALCLYDGRSSKAPKEGYGSGGALVGKKYMLSLTFNAPREAFDDPSQYLFQGKSVDDLWLPMHMNFRFFAMEALPTFACYDVMKNPEIEADFERLTAHLGENF
ncbi:NAD(P)H-dependent oxidoreductase [Ruegeria sp. R14_0]|uniref:NAD(P)H-dependent oxidoreductase n=1 Tax=Ruegeria sp. R14_0 TaxID=2821100 RepID=UPI001AD96254|nr:NAD(P)H-dependent oxidoreductase [Ruegeria sp. R14_0]MBO9447430.1 NAD(P)H-dependent oxidoreductase [Ruegeria sp. R14_0]